MRADDRGIAPPCPDAAVLVEAAPEPAFATDAAGVVRCWNEPASRLLGFSIELACGRHVDSLLRPRDVYDNPFADTNLPGLDPALRAEPVHPFEMSLRAAGGERIPVQVGVVVVLSAAGDADHRVVYLLQQRFRRRRSDEVIERLLAQPGWTATAPPPLPSSPLTPRQLEVLGLLAQGLAPQEIADELSISVYTVRSHLRAVFERLEAHSQSEAVAKAFKLRLL